MISGNGKEKKSIVDVMGVGDAMVDLSTRAPTIPQRGGNVWSTAVQMSPGGTVANVTADLACLGVSSAFVGCIGDDPYGKYALDKLRTSQVDVHEVEIKPESSTGIVLAVIDETGERTFIACAVGSSYSQLSQGHIERIDFSRTGVVQTSGVCLVEEPSRSSLLLAMKRAKEAGCTVYFDPNLRLQGDQFPDDLWRAQMAAFDFVDVVLIGDGELKLLFGEKVKPVDAVQQLFQKGISTVVIKRGALGAVLFSQTEQIIMNAFPVEVVDTTGAGDAFDAGYIAARIRGMSAQQALTYASAVAGLTITRVGARSVPAHDEILEYLKTSDIEI